MKHPLALVILVATVAAVSYGMYLLKYDVVRLEEEVARLDRELVAEHTAIKVLKAEWSYLNRPARLERLAARHLALEPVVVYGLAGIGSLPLRRDAENGLDEFVKRGPPLPIPKPLSPNSSLLVKTGSGR